MSKSFDRREPSYNVLHRVSTDVYTYVTEFLFMGAVPIHNRSVVVRVPGGLAIINPAELRPEVLRDLRRLEEETGAGVRYLISPGDWHYLFIGQHKKAFPAATVYVPPGRIPSKTPDFEYTLIDVEADHPFPALEPSIVALNFKGLRDFTDPEGALPRYELCFLIPNAHAITSGDVLYYFDEDELSEKQRAIGMVPRKLDFHAAKGRMIRDREAVRRSLGEILEWDFDRYIPIHGAPGNMLPEGAKAELRQVLAWVEAETS